MKWFRSHIKQGSRLALLALAIQFVLSFGHFHALAAQAAPAVASSPLLLTFSQADGLATPGGAGESAQRQAPSNPDSDQQPGDPCAICAVMALAQAALFSTPPLLQLPQAIEFLYLATEAEFVHLNGGRVVFQPRAPPLS
jgi:DUF2946 family protein